MEKKIDLEKASIEELKAIAWDILMEIDKLQKQSQVIVNTIAQKEQKEAK